MVKKHILKNGIRIVAEYIPYVKSISLGIWIGTGSRNETKMNNGISHFIEHMLFKGTEKRTAKEIAESIDSIGGQINAFTSKEYTCYYTKTLYTHLNIAVDVLSDMLFNSLIDPRDIELERKVILEEINMYEDSPEELVHDILSELVWKNNSLGYPILGTHESLQRINREKILEFKEYNYIPSNTVIALAGNFDFDYMIELIEKSFGHWTDKGKSQLKNYPKASFNCGQILRKKDIEQTHLCISFEGIEQGNDSIHDLLVINAILGGGMSSRLFQKIREEKGLVYSIYSYPSFYQGAGIFTIYAAMNPTQIHEVIKLIFDEIDMLCNKEQISKQEFVKIKEQLKGNYILGLESTSSIMSSIGKSELMLNKIRTPDEILNRIDAITIESITKMLEQLFNNNKIAISAVGTINENLDLISAITRH